MWRRITGIMSHPWEVGASCSSWLATSRLARFRSRGILIGSGDLSSRECLDSRNIALRQTCPIRAALVGACVEFGLSCLLLHVDRSLKSIPPISVLYSLGPGNDGDGVGLTLDGDQASESIGLLEAGGDGYAGLPVRGERIQSHPSPNCKASGSSVGNGSR